MAESQLSVRSARARDLAHRLARHEQRTIAEVVERALEAYEVAQAGRESAARFYARISESFDTEGRFVPRKVSLRPLRRGHTHRCHWHVHSRPALAPQPAHRAHAWICGLPCLFLQQLQTNSMRILYVWLDQLVVCFDPIRPALLRPTAV